jgi:hypothetical protein
MDKDGFERLITDLVDVRAPEGTPADSALATPPTPQTGAVTHDVEEPAGDQGGNGARPTTAQTSLQAPAPTSTEVKLHEIDPMPPNLAVYPEELEFLKVLSPLVPTPRAAKRIVNTYRLIRASLDEHELRQFASADGSATDYRAVQVLLAVLIGFPGEAAPLFRSLLQTSRRRSWRAFVAAFADDPDADEEDEETAAETARRRHLLAALVEGLQVKPPEQLEVYRRWAPIVARYSFETGRLGGDSASRSAAGSLPRGRRMPTAPPSS